jgi:polysaccharide export outer membrane protein
MKPGIIFLHSASISRHSTAVRRKLLSGALLWLLLGTLTIVSAQTENRQGPPVRDTGARKAESASQAEPAVRSIDSSSPGVLVTSDSDYRIGPNDVIEIQIEDAPELSGTFRVNVGGSFQMAYLGRVKAGQRTTEELAKLIADRLRDRYLADPRVMIAVKQINSHSFFVQGAVRNAGVFQIEGKPSLLELLTVAGGLAPDHGSTAFIIRRIRQQEDMVVADAVSPATSAPQTQSEEGAVKAQYTLLKANINGLFRGSFDQNMLLEPGDIINVPPTNVFFVAGEVHAPGSFPLKDGTTLRQAISLAQGTNFKAATSRGIIFREKSENGQREEIHVDIGAVMSGKKEDVPIQANDIIIVPNSKMKSVAAPMLSAFGVNMITRVPIR